MRNISKIDIDFDVWLSGTILFGSEYERLKAAYKAGREADQQSGQRTACTCRRNFEGALIKMDPNCPVTQAAHR